MHSRLTAVYLTRTHWANQRRRSTLVCMRILVTGAAGSGTSTLAHAIGSELSVSVLEADDYFWLPTYPPFTTKRDSQERLSLILRDLESTHSAVVAGSIVDWGSELEDSLSMIVFL